MKYGWVKLPTKAFAKNGIGVLQRRNLRMRITEAWKGWFAYLKYNLSIKACEGMKHAIIRNGECTLKIYTLHESVCKNILPALYMEKCYRTDEQIMYNLANSFGISVS